MTNSLDIQPREELHDAIVNAICLCESEKLDDDCSNAFKKMMMDEDSISPVKAEYSPNQYLVMTAGPIGSGKSQMIAWLRERGLLHLDNPCLIDPDEIRQLLPEWKERNRKSPYTAGYETQQEVGEIAEKALHHGLEQGRNVIFDGTMKDIQW